MQDVTVTVELKCDRHSACPSYAVITMVSILTVGLSLPLCDPSSLTERTSDNRRLGTSNDTTSVAKHSKVNGNQTSCVHSFKFEVLCTPAMLCVFFKINSDLNS